jgi:hypothetical protein
MNRDSLLAVVAELNIIDWYAENGNPAPTWQEQVGSVYVTFLPAAFLDIPRSGPSRR